MVKKCQKMVFFILVVGGIFFRTKLTQDINPELIPNVTFIKDAI